MKLFVSLSNSSIKIVVYTQTWKKGSNSPRLMVTMTTIIDCNVNKIGDKLVE